MLIVCQAGVEKAGAQPRLPSISDQTGIKAQPVQPFEGGNMKHGELDEIEGLIRSIECGNDLVELGKVIGVDRLRVVLSMLGGPLGMQVYIPSFDNFVAAVRREVRDMDIQADYDGTPASISTLAQKYGVTKTRVRQIIASG